MSNLILYVGDKNLSSWSLRCWLLLRHAGVAFEERMIRLDRPTTATELADVSPSSRVPCLLDGDLTIWESLAICEYLAEKFPEKALWPADRSARATARSVAAEMHSGFQGMRSLWPMNFAREGMRHTTHGIESDIRRMIEIWEYCRRDFGAPAGGPFLFGAFSIADAMFAPVVSRFVTYGPVSLPPASAAWLTHLWSLPAMKEWGASATAELSGR